MGLPSTSQHEELTDDLSRAWADATQGAREPEPGLFEHMAGFLLAAGWTMALTFTPGTGEPDGPDPLDLALDQYSDDPAPAPTLTSLKGFDLDALPPAPRPTFG